MRRSRPSLTRLGILVTVISLGSLIGFTPETSAQSASPPEAAFRDALSVDQVVNSDTGARITLGFRSDLPYVRDLEIRRRGGDKSAELVNGIVASPAEAIELRTRQRLQENVEIISDYGALFPDEYAGMYIDQPHGNAVVRFVANIPKHSATLSAKFVLPSRLRVTAATWTSKELHAVAQQIVASASTNLIPLRTELTAVAVSPINNNVVVYLSQIDDAVRQYFERSYPPGQVSLELGLGSVGDTVDTAGSAMTNTTLGLGCTFGFSYRTPAGGWGVLGAGHCGRAGDHVIPNSNTNQIHTVFGTSWGSLTATETMAIPTNAQQASNVIATGATITALGGAESDKLGTYVCKYGRSSLEKCGTVSAIFDWYHVSVSDKQNFPDTDVAWMRGIWLGVCNSELPGDSGGPVYLDGRAYGIIHGRPVNGCGDWALYTAAVYATQYWGIIIPAGNI